MRRKGYDIFYTEPGQAAEMTCTVCGTKCTVIRNALGPIGWAAAMSETNILHDRFECPNSDNEWHNKAIELMIEIEKSPSRRLIELMKLDLEDLLKENGV